MRDTAHSAATLLKKLGMSNPEIRPTLYLEQLGQNWGRIREIPQSTGLHPTRPIRLDPRRYNSMLDQNHLISERSSDVKKCMGGYASRLAGTAVAGCEGMRLTN